MSTNRGKIIKIIVTHYSAVFNNIINAWTYTDIGGDIMGFFNCNCKIGCTVTGLIASLVAGIVALVLNITGTITILPLFAWIGFGIAVGLLVVAFLVVAFTDEGRKEKSCICRALSTLQIGALGTILTALVLLAVDFGGISVIGAIIYGAFVFFFILLLTALACLTRCFAACGD